jgi:hypothetical protein
MPTSDIHNIVPIVEVAMQLQPRSILDLGMGSGKYGVLLREYLDVAHGRLTRKDWAVHILGVEGFPQYINNLHRSVYSTTSVEDFSDKENWEFYKGYDLAMMIDSFEHIEKQRGRELLTFLRQNNKRVLVSCPFGDNYLEQGAVYGNEFERHRAHWHPHEFVNMGGTILHRGVCCVALFL